jgi:simple sugar transport system ATP-binding protein
VFLITAYPVRGLDVGSSQFIYGKLNEEKQKGVAVLFVGEDLDVLLAFCDRVAVFFEGRLMGIFDAKAITKETVGMLMMGCQPC